MTRRGDGCGERTGALLLLVVSALVLHWSRADLVDARRKLDLREQTAQALEAAVHVPALPGDPPVGERLVAWLPQHGAPPGATLVAGVER